MCVGGGLVYMKNTLLFKNKGSLEKIYSLEKN